MRKVIVLLLFIFSISVYAQSSILFEQGKNAYAKGNYTEAIQAWSEVISKGEHSASLYFNLGNAHYKLNQIGPSVYYYEKALQLKPNDSEIQNNLAFAENARIDAIEPLPTTIFNKWYQTVSGLFTYEGWAWLSVVSSLLFTLLFLFYYFANYERNKRLFFIGSMMSLLLVLIAISFAFSTYSDFSNDQPAIIFAESSEIRNEPNMGSETSFVLHEGTKVQILAEEENWVRVQLADGKDGWMPKEDLKAL
jgi:tetratricopeptide (TPR) repeat protein